MPKTISPRQEALRAYVQEYGINAAIDGTGLPLCDIRRTYTEPDPISDHLERVYQFYRGYAHQRSLSEQDDDPF